MHLITDRQQRKRMLLGKDHKYVYVRIYMRMYIHNWTCHCFYVYAYVWSFPEGIFIACRRYTIRYIMGPIIERKVGSSASATVIEIPLSH